MLTAQELAMLADLVKRRLLDLDYAGATISANVEKGRLDHLKKKVLELWADSYRTVKS